MNRIYLDNASTAFPKAPGTAEAISGYITSGCINLYRTESRLSESGFDVLMSLRSMLSSLYGYNHMECIAFTRSITESMNWIIKGLFSSGDRVAVTANEHNAVMRPLHQVGVEIFRIPSDREGYTLWEAADSIIPPGVKGLIVNAAGNVSGAVQDLGKAAEIARRYRIPLIVDTAQSSPYTSIDMEDLGIAALGFTGHKGFLGPEGTGGMILRRDLAQMISPLIAGGTGSESDSEDLPLNVSREILQENRVMVSIRNASVKKLLGEFRKISENNPELYSKFIAEYNRPLKEGLYSDYANRDSLLDLVRYKSSTEDGYVSLKEYKSRMKADQKAIYYITGGKEEVLRTSPLVAAYREKGYEVLIMGDDIDDIVVASIGEYDKTPLKAINKAGALSDLKSDEDKAKEEAKKPVAEKIRKALGDRVKDVVISSRLTDTPAAVILSDDDPSVQMQRLL